MLAAMLSSMISSRLLISRASSMTCWQSRTSMPWRFSSNSTGGSTRSTPIGILATPFSLRSALISVTALSINP